MDQLSIATAAESFRQQNYVPTQVFEGIFSIGTQYSCYMWYMPLGVEKGGSGDCGEKSSSCPVVVTTEKSNYFGTQLSNTSWPDFCGFSDEFSGGGDGGTGPIHIGHMLFP